MLKQRVVKIILLTLAATIAVLTCTLAIVNRPVSLYEILDIKKEDVIFFSLNKGVHPAEVLSDPYGRYGYGFAADEAEAIPFLAVLGENRFREIDGGPMDSAYIPGPIYPCILLRIRGYYGERPTVIQLDLYHEGDEIYIRVQGCRYLICSYNKLLDPDYITALIDQKGMSANERKALYE